jgi:hypothetical protein
MPSEEEPSRACGRIRLGHAYWSTPQALDTTDLETVLRILSGELALEPRPPSDNEAVRRAEATLGVTNGAVYVFVGCLHPKLGTIGLILSTACLEGRLLGVTRCDSGGLAGRRGSFVYVEENEVDNCLLSLSILGDGPGWLGAFTDEVLRSYFDVRGYVVGTVPDVTSWTDVRARCIDSPQPPDGIRDRRLWTWEARLGHPPETSAFEALVLSTEAFKHLERLRELGQEVPSHVRVLHGTISEAGVHYFSDEAVSTLLCGGVH